ncbi:ATP-binding protein [Pararobbsia silviterrae]|uniref:histidine kinase n=1 Tax=Pararobbsia silviterrae TaxID=1792498 RepID=A0A494YE02_9BURK|nr:ATP-binding protein [Pararobbsia silviterrae]RKP58573.1 sensor histidine kinase [Pararobbsia silviterrae]
MNRFSNSPRVNLSQLFWLRCLAIMGQLLTITIAQTLLGVHLPIAAMLFVIALEALFNAATFWRANEARTETERELFGQLFVDLGTLSALLFLSGGTTNPFVSLYLPGLAIAAAVLPWTLALILAAFSLCCYGLLAVESIPLNIDEPSNLFDYYRTGAWINFVVSVGLIAWFVARMSRTLRARDAALASAQQQLLRDERVVALGAQAATVAHEMGTPLSTISMLAEELRLAAETDGDLGAYRADLQTLEQQIALCRSALARLQSRAASPDRQEIGRWLDVFARQWRLRHPHVRFEWRTAPALESIYVEDAVAVGQTLTILLDNAARVSRDYVTLTVDAVDASLLLTVEDRGPGIAPPLRAQLGKAPVTSDQGGHGVGLYLASVTAARLSGRIEISQADPHGTRATLTLPARALERAERANSGDALARR